LLLNFKEASDKLEAAEKRKTSLEVAEVDLMDALMEARRNESIDYKAIIDGEPNNEEKIDKLIRSYQLINLREDNRELSSEKKQIEKEIGSYRAKRRKLDEEINKLKPKFTNQRREELKDYITKTDEAITRLKNDLQPGNASRLILEEAIKDKKKTAEIIFKTSHTYTDSIESIIKTSIKDSYSTNKYTHPTYLTEDLSGQMMDFFKQFDEDKLFTLITNNFSAAEAKKIKDAYKRVVNARVEYVPDFVGQEAFIPELLGAGEVVTGKGQTLYYEELKEANDRNLFLSDIFYFMNAFFPQGDAGTGYSNSKYLEEGGADALPFTNANSLTTEHKVIWRGRVDGLAGKKYKDTPNVGAYLIDSHFHPETLHLS